MTDTADATVEAAAESTQQVPNKLPHLDLEKLSPTFDRSRKGGYVEEGVDIYIQNFFGSANQLIDQHNQIVDLWQQANEIVLAQQEEIANQAAEIENLHAQLDAAEATKAEAVEEATVAARNAGDEKLESFRAEANDYISRLTDAHDAQTAKLENDLTNLREVLAVQTLAEDVPPAYNDEETIDVVQVVDDQVEALEENKPEVADDFIQAGAELLARARDTAAKFVEDAKNKSAQLVEDAEAEAETIKSDAVTAVEDAKREKEELERLNSENLNKLEGFFESQLEAVRQHRKPYDPSDVS